MHDARRSFSAELVTYIKIMTTKEIIKLQSLLCKMRPGPYEYWNGQGDEVLAAECDSNGDGWPIAVRHGLKPRPDEFAGIAALLNAAPELIKLALLAKLAEVKSQREAAGTADEKPDGQAENASVEARQ